MRLVPFALMPSSPRSPLLVAYNLYSQAEFAECLAELAGLSSQLAGADAIEAALLRARSLLRLDRPTEAGSALELPLEALDDDLRCTVQALRGFGLVSAGRHSSGMQMIDAALERANTHDVHDSVRLEALYHRAFAHWLIWKYEEAEADAIRSYETQIDGVCARAVALRGWIRIGRRRHAEALPFFRSAARTFSASLVRDAAFEASVVHALANYEWEVLDQAGEPHYYSDQLPRVPGTSMDTYRLLVAHADAWRAALEGDESRALIYAARTEAVDVVRHWRAFGLTTRAGVARAFGHERFARMAADVAFEVAMGADWSASPAESRLALLYGADRLAPADVNKARTLLAAYKRIGTAIPSRYQSGSQPIHQAIEAHVRGVVAAEQSDRAMRSYLRCAYETFSQMGYQWRAVASQLVLGRDDSVEARRAYREARAFLIERFPRSFLARSLHDYTPPLFIPSSEPLTPAQVTIVRALCAGKSPRRIAEERGTSLGTVRNQIKHIYQRIDVHSVEDLRRRYGDSSA